MTTSGYLNETITRIDADGIRIIRARLGLTQDQLAGKLDVSLGTVRSWEQGNRNPAPDVRAKLIYLSRPSMIRASKASEALREAANQYDANAIALDIEGDDESAARSRSMAAKLHSMATAHEDAGKIDPTDDPMQVVNAAYANHG